MSTSVLVELAPGLRCSEDTADQAAEALFRSTLSRSRGVSGSDLYTECTNEVVPVKPEHVQPPHYVRFVDELDLKAAAGLHDMRLRDNCKEEDDLAERAIEEVTRRRISHRVRRLDQQLYIFSAISSLLTLICLLQISHTGSSTRPASAHMTAQDWLIWVPSAPIVVLACYVSLLLTFRTGVRRIALSIDADSEKEEDEVVSSAGGSTPHLSLNGRRGLFIQGLTLLSATALLHIPVHALQHLSLQVGMAGWCLSTSLGGLVMWDAIAETVPTPLKHLKNQQANEVVAEKEELIEDGDEQV